MKKVVFLVFFITFLTKIFGFFRDILLSYFYGASSITDSYLISLTIPGTIFEFVGAAIATSFIPIYFTILNNKDGEAIVKKFVSNILNCIIFFSVILTIIIFLFTKPLVLMFASGFSGKTLADAIFFTRISALSLAFSGCIFVYNSLLQAKGKYHLAVIFALPSSLITLILIILSYFSTYKIIGFISLITIMVQLFLILLFSRKYISSGWTLRIPYLGFNEKAMLKLSIPVFLGVSINQINVLVDRTLASNILSGGISIINYSNKLMLFLHGSFVMIILTLIFPKIAKLAMEKNNQNVSILINKMLYIFIIILVPIVILLIINCESIIKLIYGRGAVNSEELKVISTTFSIYLSSLLFLGLRELFLKVCYAYKNVKLSTYNSISSLLLNIILSLVFYKVFNLGLNGLALGTSLATIISCITLMILVNKKVVKYFDISVLKKYTLFLLSFIFIFIIGILINRFTNEYIFVYNIVLITLFLIIFGFNYKKFNIKEL